MAIIVKTANPKGLLQSIYEAIDEKKVETWEYDSDKDFTHTPQQWYKKAYLRPEVGVAELRFGILGLKDIVLTKELYGVYHGRFIEMLLTHFDTQFSLANATAEKTSPDNFK